MKASIVIPNLNGAGWLRDSIESIWAQMEQDFELIIIDNLSLIHISILGLSRLSLLLRKQ